MGKDDKHLTILIHLKSSKGVDIYITHPLFHVCSFSETPYYKIYFFSTGICEKRPRIQSLPYNVLEWRITTIPAGNHDMGCLLWYFLNPDSNILIFVRIRNTYLLIPIEQFQQLNISFWSLRRSPCMIFSLSIVYKVLNMVHQLF